MASNNNLDQYHSVLDETFKRKTDSARLVVYGLPAKVSKQAVEHNFFLRHDFQALQFVYIPDKQLSTTTFANLDFNSVGNAALFLDKDLSGPVKYKRTYDNFLYNGHKYILSIKPVEPCVGCKGLSFFYIYFIKLL